MDRSCDRLRRGQISVFAATVLALAPAGVVAQVGYLTFPSTLVEQMGTFPEISPISGTASILNATPRTYMSYLDETLYTGQLTQPVLIVGMQIRLAMGTNWRLQTPASYTASTWPNVDAVMPMFDVRLGRATTLFEGTGWFRDLNGNWLRGPFDAYFTNVVQVRSGPLTIPANSFVASGGATGVHAWGPTFHFTTPYVYSPGETLVYEVRHLGVDNAGDVVPALFASRFGARNFTDAMLATSAFAVEPATLSNVHYVRWVTMPIPEPAVAGLLAPTAALLLRRRPSSKTD